VITSGPPADGGDRAHRRARPGTRALAGPSRARDGAPRRHPGGRPRARVLARVQGRRAEDARFLAGETIGSLFDRVLPAVDRLLADEGWDILLAVLHGGVNRAILSRALTGGRTFLGNLEQSPACINVLDVGDDWIVRAVNVTPYDLSHRAGRTTTMEELWQQFRST
jgi:probable phosphoglycerate mutase